jgi:heme/copper-type cytochrome/quinol oxidase subunit 3
MTAAASKAPTQLVEIDVSELKSFAFGQRSTLFWGTALLCLIEGTALALLFTAYFYVRGNFYEWPPSARIPPLVGVLSTVTLVLTLVPMRLTAKAARTMDLARTRRWQIISTVLGAVALGLRAWEMHDIPFLWTENAYASIVWTSIGFHTVDFIVELGESIVLCAILLKGPLEKKHFEDIEVNAIFWAFLVLIWLPFAGVFYLDGAIR